MYYLVEWVSSGNGRYLAPKGELTVYKRGAAPFRSYQEARDYRTAIKGTGKFRIVSR